MLIYSQHPFIVQRRLPSVLNDLIQRTKDAVRELDNLIGSRFKKLLVDSNNEQSDANSALGGAFANDDSTVRVYISRQILCLCFCFVWCQFCDESHCHGSFIVYAVNYSSSSSSFIVVRFKSYMHKIITILWWNSFSTVRRSFLTSICHRIRVGRVGGRKRFWAS